VHSTPQTAWASWYACFLKDLKSLRVRWLSIVCQVVDEGPAHCQSSQCYFNRWDVVRGLLAFRLQTCSHIMVFGSLSLSISLNYTMGLAFSA
jgi:hypothetical protein